MGVASLAACAPPDPMPLPPNSIAFGVFGDAPYYVWEQRPFERLLDDVSRTDIAWLLHVGDMLWYPCSDEAFKYRLDQLNGVAHPVVYTPGDNEWTDCHEEKPGRYDPLDRLASIRRMFFADPSRSLGSTQMRVTSQGLDSAFAEFRENVRWSVGGLVFATIHLVGSSNGLDPFSGRTAAHDAEARRRTAAAIAWLDGTFALADSVDVKGIILATHANIGIGERAGSTAGFEPFIQRLESHVQRYNVPILFIHGDSHTPRVDHPLTDDRGRPYPNFTRLETFGSPTIGWMRVAMDTLTGQLASYESRVFRGWW